MIPFEATTCNQALGLAQGYIDRVSGCIPTMPDAEVEWTDEGDWSLAIQSGSHTYAIHPTDKTYTTFVDLRHTAESVEHLFGPTSLDRALGRVA